MFCQPHLKRSGTFILLCFIAFDSFAQLDLINRTVMRQDSSFVFQDMKNEFEITGVKNGAFQLRAANAKIEKGNTPELFWVESERLGPDTFFLSQNGKVALKKIFTVIPWGNIVVHWGTLKRDTATASEVIANRKMIMSLTGSNTCPRCRIFSCKIAFTTNQFPAHDKVITLDGAVLTPEAVNLVSTLRQGDKVEFSSIHVGFGDGRIREWPPFSIYIE